MASEHSFFGEGEIVTLCEWAVYAHSCSSMKNLSIRFMKRMDDGWGMPYHPRSRRADRLNVAFKAGVFSLPLFTVLVVMALITTMMTRPILNWPGLEETDIQGITVPRAKTA